MEQKVFIAGAARTAIGAFGGSLKEISPRKLGESVVRKLVEDSLIVSDEDGTCSALDEIIFGNVLGAGQGMNIARQIALDSRISKATPAWLVNQVCGSGLKAVAIAADSIGNCGAECIIAGGVENMSQAVYVSKSARWGGRMGNSEMIDLMINDGLTDAFSGEHMGITAENVAEKYNVSREAQDAFACESQKRTSEAIEKGYFNDEIVPVPVFKRGKRIGDFAQDEHPRRDVTIEKLTAMKPAFKKGGTVTAGNCSGINDGAAALLLVSENKVGDLFSEPLAEIVASATAGVEPDYMGIGPVKAVKKLIEKTGISLEQVDLIEANEAFAAQALAVNSELGLDQEKVNICGGAIALGHPIGASGARILVTLVHQLRRIGGTYGIATLCVGGGQGVAVLIKNLK